VVTSQRRVLMVKGIWNSVAVSTMKREYVKKKKRRLLTFATWKWEIC
jgi:hypothetical protein